MAAWTDGSPLLTSGEKLQGDLDGRTWKSSGGNLPKNRRSGQSDEIEIWGDGKQTRSFLYIDECIEGIRKLMGSNEPGPFNIGSEEMVTINQLARLVMDIAGKTLPIRNITGPLGVLGRNSDNRLIAERLVWSPNRPLREPE